MATGEGAPKNHDVGNSGAENGAEEKERREKVIALLDKVPFGDLRAAAERIGKPYDSCFEIDSWPVEDQELLYAETQKDAAAPAGETGTVENFAGGVADSGDSAGEGAGDTGNTGDNAGDTGAGDDVESPSVNPDNGTDDPTVNPDNGTDDPTANPDNGTEKPATDPDNGTENPTTDPGNDHRVYPGASPEPTPARDGETGENKEKKRGLRGLLSKVGRQVTKGGVILATSLIGFATVHGVVNKISDKMSQKYNNQPKTENVGGAIGGGFDIIDDQNNDIEPIVIEATETDAKDEAADEATAENAEENEQYAIQDNYDYYNVGAENKNTVYSFCNAADIIKDMLEAGKLDKDNLDERAIVMTLSTMNNETFASYLAPATGETLEDTEKKLESMTKEEKSAAVKEFSEWLSTATIEYVTCDDNDLWENNYIDNKSNPGSGHIESSDDAMACISKTNENGRKFMKITGADGRVLYSKINLEDAVITQNEDGTFMVVLNDADGSEYKYCGQPLKKTNVPPDTNINIPPVVVPPNNPPNVPTPPDDPPSDEKDEDEIAESLDDTDLEDIKPVDEDDVTDIPTIDDTDGDDIKDYDEEVPETDPGNAVAQEAEEKNKENEEKYGSEEKALDAVDTDGDGVASLDEVLQ